MEKVDASPATKLCADVSHGLDPVSSHTDEHSLEGGAEVTEIEARFLTLIVEYLAPEKLLPNQSVDHDEKEHEETKRGRICRSFQHGFNKELQAFGFLQEFENS